MKIKKHTIARYCTFFLLMAALLITISSCTKDQVPDRDKFLGLYSVFENCESGNYSYEINIIESASSENAVIIMNLYDYDENISATVNGNNITIASQVYDGITYSGDGFVSDNGLTINFTASDTSESDRCVANCTRK